MKCVDMKIVRIYITESSDLLKEIMKYLNDVAKVRGVSVFRAIKGFGESGQHTSSLADLSLDLPLTIEFFDVPEKVDNAIAHISQTLKPKHIVFWNVQTNN